MTDFVSAPLTPARIEWQGSTPASPVYGDSYYMAGMGVEESSAVFLQASRLEQRFASLPPNGLFVIGETGFGTGLNALLAAQSFVQHAPPGAQLQFFSAELHPLCLVDLKRALEQWPQLEKHSRPLLEQWPGSAPGFHRLCLSQQVELTLMLGDANVLWPAGPDGVDAWFLDGFAPARNPGMWTEALFATLFRKSSGGATVATFSAAGAVRRGLENAGFEVERHPGFGGKRHRITAHKPGPWQPQRYQTGHATVAGAGLAGCTTARALAERGWQVDILDPDPGLDSPLPLAAVLYATASHHLNAQNRFYLGALAHALRWLDRHNFPDSRSHGRMNGLVQHPFNTRMAEKIARAATAGAWPPELLRTEDSGRAVMPQNGCLNVHAWRGRLLDHPRITLRQDAVKRFSHNDPVQVKTTGGLNLQTDRLILCTAGATGGFPGLDWLGLRRARGQVTLCRATQASQQVQMTHCHSGYFTPAINGIHCVGATFDRQRGTATVIPEDDRHNLATLKKELPLLWQALGGENIEIAGQFAGLRCQSRDSLPIVGPLPDPRHNPHSVSDRIWLNIAHGSRGLTHTPLCADLVADLISGLPAPADEHIVAALAPARFIERQRRRNPDWLPGTSLKANRLDNK